MIGHTARLTQRVMRCSNELCEFHLKDGLFRQENLVSIVYDVLRPAGEFAPVPTGFKFFCSGCGWVYTPQGPGDKPGTVPPEADPTGDGKIRPA